MRRKVAMVIVCNAIGNFLNQLIHRLRAVGRRQLQADRGKFESAIGPQTVGTFQLFTDTPLDDGGSMCIGGNHDHYGFHRAQVIQGGQDRVLVAEDAGFQDLQAMLANLLPGWRRTWARA